MPWPIPDVPTLDKPQSPIGWRWFAFMVVILAVWIAGTLLLWPQDQSATTLKFWLTLLAFPILIWGVLFGLRLHWHDQGTMRTEAWEEETRAVQERWRQWGNEALTVLDYSLYLPQELTSFDIKTPDGNALFQEKKCLRLSLENTLFTSTDDNTLDARRQSLYANMLKNMQETIHTLRAKHTLIVHLLDNGLTKCNATDIQASFVQAWQTAELGPLPSMANVVKQDTTLLDDWLTSPSSTVQLVLITQIQPHETDVQASEGGAALLLMPVARSGDWPHRAQLPRSLSSASEELVISLQQLLDAQQDRPPFQHLWLTGLSNQQNSALLNALDQTQVDLSQDDNLSGQHLFDHYVGRAGTLTPWIMLTAAIDSMADEPQLLASTINKKVILNRVLPTAPNTQQKEVWS